ncbi:DUF4232 domain-containing protein [Streptomyces sp. NPDC005648]|uniref:DUF4232 domain-containing protein n=1 Tax=Streptomyces sp. NPDC005648 TaxID=3157044 RepID=UPI00339FEFD3
MSKLRASRTRLVGAATTVVLAALSLTACGNGTGVHGEGVAAVTTPTAKSSSPAPSPSASAADSGSDSATPKTGPATRTSAPAVTTPAAKSPGTAKAPARTTSSDKPVTCEGSDTRTVAAPLTRPVNHMLLTVTNTGSKPCFLYYYPAVNFGQEQSVPPVIEDSQPQAVVTLDPGESGYASVSLSATDGSGKGGYTSKSLAVYFFGRSGSGSVGAGAHPALPAKGVHVDDSLEVTYWQQTLDAALNW